MHVHGIKSGCYNPAIDLLFAINDCRTHLTEGKLCQTLSNPLYSYNESVLSPSIIPQNIVSV